jgi:phosphoserine phosphatase
VFLSYLWKMPQKQLQSHAEHFADWVLQHWIYPEVRAELEQHQKAGRRTILNTASPDIYPRAIAQRLGFDHCYSTRVAWGAGERVPFCPAIVGPNNKRAAKLTAMAEILPPGCLEPGAAPLADSYAYSDSHADLPMMRLAQHGVMIHPTAELAAEGAQRGWKTLRPKRPFQGKAGFRLACIRQALGL